MNTNPFVELVDISKSFPGVKALSDVSIAFYPGKVHVLLGENGAGKSTIIKIISGVYQADAGKLLVGGQEYTFTNTRQALAHGVSVIHQELSVIPDLTVAENIFLGREPKIARTGLIDRATMFAETKKLLDSIGVKINPRAVIRTLTNGDKQMVEIARAVSQNSSMVIMDEPTSSLSDHEVEALFRVINKLKSENVAVIYISHRMKEIFEIGDNITILRDGQVVKTMPLSETDEQTMIALMVGRQVTQYYYKAEAPKDSPVVLSVKNLTRRGVFQNVSFDLHQGEVLGVSGLIGAGRTEVMRAIFGADPGVTGDLYIKGTKTRISSPKAAVRHGLAFVTEDRKHTGIIAGMAVDQNITLSSLQNYAPGGFLRHRLEEETAGSYVKELKIKTPTVNTDIASLSGGNQQKALLARWLCTEADVIIMDEPTRGIDVGAKREIYMLINQLTQMGKAVIMVSSDLPEVLGMSDRIMVMSGGAITGELDARKADQVAVMRLATKDVQV